MIYVFDLFGVVIDWRSEYVLPEWAKYAGVSQEAFKKGLSPDIELCEAGKISMADFWKRLAKKFNVDADRLESSLIDCFEKCASLNQDVLAIIDGVRKYAKVYLLSNQLPLHAEICKKYSLGSHFDRMFLSFELDARKPEKESYEAVVKKLGVAPGNCVLIDDKEKNVAEAMKLGMNGIVFSNAAQLKRELDKYVAKEEKHVA